MLRHTGWLIGIMLLAAACDASVTADADNNPSAADDDDDQGPKTKQGECGLIDIACPDQRPHPGSPCEGALTCTYSDEEITTFTATCTEGAWTETAECSEEVIGGSCGGIPAAAETCGSPFNGTMEATLEVGPPPGSEAFRTFQEGELLSPEIGGQGSAMLWFTIRVDGEELPDCARVTSNLESDVFYDPGEQISDVKLRCGATLGMYAVLPASDCENLNEGDVVDLTFTVEVTGIGEVSYPLRIAYEDLCFLYY